MYALIMDSWNRNADELNQWGDLGEDEKIKYAVWYTAARCKQIAQQRYLAENQAVDIDLTISKEFDV